MLVEANDPIDYYLKLDDERLHLNPHIGANVTLTWTGTITCISCGNETRKSYSQGHCYPCFKKLASCDLCVVSPERCHYDAGTCRDPDWGESFCMQQHLVYLANSSGIKVGITKEANLPTRWIDQGAVQAIPVIAVQTRQQSGFVEVAFKNHISDKTQWQRMLKADAPHIDMQKIRDDLLATIEPELDALRQRFGIQAIQPLTGDTQIFHYPVQQYTTKVSSMSFDKTPDVGGALLGIKGQYLIFDTGVINLRKFTGYEIEFSAGAEKAERGRQLSLL
ncbi:MAG TPA: DUF2797 domain-containing protein [Gammaproteobacteria bacterium]|nr:DUF2797 domain-containing protein [Gammaproteobacteria bacterium]